MLFRSLLPSWKFFEDIGDNAVLYYKTQNSTENSDGSWSEWQTFHQPIVRRTWHLLFNPFLNLQLAEKSALQHAVAQLSTTESESLISLKIIESMVAGKIYSGTLAFQFKIALHSEGDTEDIYTSPVVNR